MFLSTATNTLDAKGRISVPADFRAVVGDGSFDGIVIWPSFDGSYLEGGGMKLMRAYQALIEAMDPYDEARIAFERTIFAGSRRLSFDGTGRITLPKEFAEYANLSGSATFIGLGSRFEIWNPDDHKIHAEQARKLASENKHRLSVRSNAPLVRGE
jgi:MraZ protein